MALGGKTSGQIHNRTGADLAAMKAKYDTSKHLEYVGYDEVDMLLYQIQLMQDDIDELRRYIVSAELLLPDTMGDSIPTSDPSVAGQLWSNRGVLSISRG